MTCWRSPSVFGHIGFRSSWLALNLLSEEAIHLDWHDKRIGVGLHAHKALVAACTEPDQTFGEVAEVVILFDFPSLVFVVQMGDEPVLRVLEDVGADRTDLLGGVDQAQVQLGALLGDPVVDLAEVFVLLAWGRGCEPPRSRTG